MATKRTALQRKRRIFRRFTALFHRFLCNWLKSKICPVGNILPESKQVIAWLLGKIYRNIFQSADIKRLIREGHAFCYYQLVLRTFAFYPYQGADHANALLYQHRSEEHTSELQ